MIRTEVIRPVGELLRARAADRAEAVAVSDEHGQLSYTQLERRTRALAGRLRGLGVAPGERVLLFLGNGVALVECYLGVVRAGAVAVCINAISTPAEAAFVVHDCAPSAVVVGADQLATLADWLPAGSGRRPAVVVATDDTGGTDKAGDTAGIGAGLLSLASLADPDTGPDERGLDELELDAPAWMLYTSGTTGRPKGVVLSQRNLLWVAAAAWLPFLEITERDVVLNPLPLSHSYPLDVTLACLAVGARVHLLRRFRTEQVAAALRALPASALLCVPTTVAYLLNHVAAGEHAAPPFPALRYLVTAGAVAGPAVCERARRELGVPLLDAYGSTEASTAITLNALHGARSPGSCGVPAPGWAVRIVDPATGADVPTGEEGELIARGPGVMLGYHNRPAETAAALRGGWYWSGDLARADANGFLTISGRVKDVIIRGAENIAPAEIELAAASHPDVADCAAVGRDDPVLGQVPVLFVCPVPGSRVAGEELRRWCARTLAPYKVPAVVALVDEIPRTASGKVRRHLLRVPEQAPGR